MNPFQLSKGNPAGIDFEALKAASKFNRKPVPRLRDLKADDAQEALFLPPDPALQEQALAETEVMTELAQQEVSAPVSRPTPETHEATEKQEDLQALAQQAKIQKSALRTEKLKDLQHDLVRCFEEDSAPDPNQLKQTLLNLQSRLSLAYTGKLAISEQAGMSLVRPFLQRQSQKIECLRLNKPEMLDAVFQAEAKILSRLRAANPLLPLERSALLCLGEAISKGLRLIFAELETVVTENRQAAPNSEIPEVLSPEQIESRLYALRNQLRNCKEDEKPAIQAEIEGLQAELDQRAVAARLERLSRLQRSLDQQGQQLREIQADLQQVPYESHCRHLHRDALSLKNRSLNELKRAAQQFPSAYPLHSAISSFEKFAGYFQSLQETPAFHQGDCAAYELPTDFQASAAESQALHAILRALEALSRVFSELKTQIQTALRRTRAEAKLAALTALESEWNTAEVLRQGQIEAYWQSDQEPLPALQLELLKTPLERLSELQKLRRTIPAMA
ncbi:hypothetical protein COW36_06500 [bacterium (Candidatus Blackallbacteria) CG17_big_fil_post_rev_8_21_14_2_50_48_46]|uniref:Uncharacterized protein n=1 Tax=bacterium (Candidatus Blackallbacteria) CG17_big_fil_post_rev_8_21_14_2_50_48_46 TaxID=2014261 RepID=A0A2M7G7P5_9BACT|nr:MAG: hypothetical protein COW36_06500 [bacterium (Candidatus Blackallbacteria) CG17_big_fil_post_rev_8_21_14_2_50_48_46]